MGYYLGKRENPCPRCGGTVWTAFISVGAMSYSEQCDGCGAASFTEDEGRLLVSTDVVAEARAALAVPKEENPDV